MDCRCGREIRVRKIPVRGPGLTLGCDFLSLLGTLSITIPKFSNCLKKWRRPITKGPTVMTTVTRPSVSVTSFSYNIMISVLKDIHNSSVQFEVKEYGKITFFQFLFIFIAVICKFKLFKFHFFQFFPSSR